MLDVVASPSNPARSQRRVQVAFSLCFASLQLQVEYFVHWACCRGLVLEQCVGILVRIATHGRQIALELLYHAISKMRFEC